MTRQNIATDYEASHLGFFSAFVTSSEVSPQHPVLKSSISVFLGWDIRFETAYETIKCAGKEWWDFVNTVMKLRFRKWRRMSWLF
jgi:hypothetical protein